MKKVFALRGATQAENTGQSITERIAALYDALLSENSLCEEEIISIIFSITSDLTAKNPASALRASGRAKDAALFSAAEPEAGDFHPGIIRILIHCYLESGASPRHIYQCGAEILRPDRAFNSL
ncbi:MAG: chorismate mutase [Spirochaetaceae bacterium]|jgi:chorismate mutase|nr:chorismate mutase [Spirochaetaceae bacterium]GMO28915.1 MAG: chorismate mutase [Termitinemataceae bacterium]